MGTYKFSDLEEIIEEERAHAHVKATFAEPCAAGMPCSRKGVEYYVKAVMGIDPEVEEESFNHNVDRILAEIGEENLEKAEDELSEGRVYDMRFFRRDEERGAYLKGHMVQAMIKNAASRMGVFMSKRGSKGDMSEGARVEATGMSLLNEDNPRQVYLVDPLGKPVQTEFKEMKGSVTSPKGRVSICHHSEMAPIGTRLEFIYSWLPNKVKEKDMLRVLAGCFDIGLGSSRGVQCGRLQIDEVEITMPKKAKTKTK